MSASTQLIIDSLKQKLDSLKQSKINTENALCAARDERDRLKEDNDVLRSQIENADVNLEQVRLCAKALNADLMEALKEAVASDGVHWDWVPKAEAAIAKGESL